MGYIIYIDVYFFVNFLMNGLLLWLLRKVDGKGRTPIKAKETLKMTLGALAGGILSCLMVPVFQKMSFLLRFFLVHGVLAYLMIWITFDYKSVKQRLKAVMRLSLLEIILSGILNMLMNEGIFFQRTVSGSEVLEKNNMISIVGTGAFTVLILGRILLYYQKENYVHSHLYEIKLVHKGNSCEGVGLLDTGNHLKDPISGKAVVIGTFKVVEGLFGTEAGIRWIPYHSLGKKNGGMPGVIVDEMIIYQEGKPQVSKKVLVGIVKEELSVEGKYQFILHEEYMEKTG